MDIKEKHLKGLIYKTTGVPIGSPMLDGVLDRTVPERRRDTPEIHKVPKHEVGKTQARSMGQVPYAGKMY